MTNTYDRKELPEELTVDIVAQNLREAFKDLGDDDSGVVTSAGREFLVQGGTTCGDDASGADVHEPQDVTVDESRDVTAVVDAVVIDQVSEPDVFEDRPEPKTGQSAPPREITWDSLNAKELRILSTLFSCTEPSPIKELADICFSELAGSPAKANSWVRNSLRRLIQGSLVTKVERGTYAITDAGQSEYRNAMAALSCSDD